MNITCKHDDGSPVEVEVLVQTIRVEERDGTAVTQDTVMFAMGEDLLTCVGPTDNPDHLLTPSGERLRLLR